MPELTEQQKSFYLEQGYLLMESVLPVDDLQPLISEFEQMIDEAAQEVYQQGKLPDPFSDEPFERRLAKIYAALDETIDPSGQLRERFWFIGQGKHQKTAGMFKVYTHAALLEIVESLIGPEILAHPQFNSRAKLPNQDESVVPWHQDLGYLEREADDTFMVIFWIPLVDATMQMGAMQVIPTSHRWPLLPHVTMMAGEYSYDGIPESDLPPHEVMDCPVPLGGVLMLQSRTVHRSVPNVTDKVRWNLDLRFSDLRAPTGRPSVPGFIAHSVEHPEKVAKSHHEWQALMTQTRS